MESGIGEAIEIARVVVMQMGDDDVADRTRLDAEPFQRIDRIERQLAGAALGLFGVEAGVDQDVAASPSDQPDEVVEVLRRGLVRVRRKEIHVRGARHRRIAQRVNFVGISHRCPSSCGLRLSDARTKPLSSAKVKPPAVWPPQEGRSYGAADPAREPGFGSQSVRTSAIYSPSFPPPRRAELSQLMMTCQAVDGLRGSFDNAVCVE